VNKKTLTILIVYSLAVASFVIYYPTLFNHVISWEDTDLFDVVSSFLKGKIGLFSNANYAPLELAFLAFQRSFSEHGYFLFHALSIIGHAVNAIMVFFLIRKLFKSERIAFVVSMLFALHPVQVGSVAWLSAQNVVLSTLLLLLACFAYLRFKGDRKRTSWWFVVGLSTLFFATGSPALNLILTLIGIDILIDSEFKVEHITGKAFLFLLWLIALLFRAEGSGGLDYLLQICYDSLAMMRLGIVEIVVRVLMPFTDILVTSGDEVALKSSVLGEPMFPLIFVLLGAMVVWNRKRHPLIFSGFLFLTLTSLPLFTGRAGGEWVLTDRSFYLSVVGVFLGFGELLEKLMVRFKERRAANWACYVLCGCILLTLAYITRTKTQYWKDSTTFWGKAHDENPTDTFILTKRGMYHYSRYEIRQALDDLDMVVKLAPEDEQSFINRGTVRLDALEFVDAINDFRQAIRLRPSDPLAYYEAGLSFTRASMFDSAQVAFSRTLELNPAFFQAFDGRANAFAMVGNYVLAFADYRQALALSPNYAEAYGKRALMFLQTGNFQKALGDFRKQIELAPNRFDAKIHCGLTELLIGDTASAVSHFSSAMRADSANAKLYLLTVSQSFLRSQREKQAGQLLFHQIGIQ